jgi:hypothetical protein
MYKGMLRHKLRGYGILQVCCQRMEQTVLPQQKTLTIVGARRIVFGVIQPRPVTGPHEEVRRTAITLQVRAHLYETIFTVIQRQDMVP